MGTTRKRATGDSGTGRRAFWKRRMDEGRRFMEAVARYPVEECGEGLRPLRDAAREAGVEVAFSDTETVPGFPRLFFLREGLIARFVAAARAMNERGWVLKVEDAHRNRQMQKRLAVKEQVIAQVARRLLWECGGRRPSPALIRGRLQVLVAHCPKTGTHMSGSALDISVLKRDDGSEVDRGAPYLEMSELTPMSSPYVSDECRRTRRAISAIMQAQGFIAYPYEFWHYSSGDAIAELILGSGTPGRYGPVDMDPGTTRVRAIEDACAPLNTEREIVEQVECAMDGLGRARGTA
jgi:D-alanyl-D-alanine dipeptidase